MNLIKQINEATNKDVGLVVSYVDGNFEDIAFVDYETHNQLPTGYSQNLASYIIKHIKNEGNNDFEGFVDFVKNRFHGKRIEGYSDNLDILYGPFSNDQLSKLDDDYLRHVEPTINEELDVSEHDSLEILKKYQHELQAELKDAKEDGDEELIDEIEQDIFDVGQLIHAKGKK